jgi:hypothetical protein
LQFLFVCAEVCAEVGGGGVAPAQGRKKTTQHLVVGCPRGSAAK